MKRKALASLGTAALLAAIASPAFADDVTSPTTTQNPAALNVTNSAPNTSAIKGNAGSGTSGSLGLNATAGQGNQQANVVQVQPAANGVTQAYPVQNQNRISSLSTINDFGGGTSTIGDMAALNVTGNVGANSAAGQGNMQSNVLIYTKDATSQLGTGNYNSAPSPFNQTQLGSNVAISQFGSTDAATIGGQAAQGTSGNVGLNSAAGAMNQQANMLYLSTGATGANPGASWVNNNSVQVGGNAGNALPTQAFQTSSGTITGSAGNSASGNVGLNAAGGAQNQQLNQTNVLSGGSYTFWADQFNFSHSQTSGTGSANQVFGSSAATINGSVGNGASGVVGANASGGILNQQGNFVDVVGPTVTPGNGFSGQAISQDSSGLNAVQFLENNASSIGGTSGKSVNGVAGFNASAGISNQQANLVTVHGETGLGSLSVPQRAGQSLAGGTLTQGGSHSTSTIGDSAAAGAKGVAAFSSAAGVSNMQSNALNVYSNGAQLPNPDQFGYQAASGYTASQSGAQTSLVNGNAAQAANGVVGLNEAAGIANQQSNTAFVVNGASWTNSSTQTSLQSADTSGKTQTQNGASQSGITENAAQGVKGVVGANSAAGIGNQQQNLTVVTNGSTLNPAVASAGQGLATGSNASARTNVSQGANNNSHIDGKAFAGTSGTVGANSAGGALGQQTNILLVTSGNLAAAAPTATQTIGAFSATQTGTNTSTIGGAAFSGSTGNVGANSGSGAGNQQANVVQVSH